MLRQAISFVSGFAMVAQCASSSCAEDAMHNDMSPGWTKSAIESCLKALPTSRMVQEGSLIAFSDSRKLKCNLKQDELQCGVWALDNEKYYPYFSIRPNKLMVLFVGEKGNFIDVDMTRTAQGGFGSPKINTTIPDGDNIKSQTANDLDANFITPKDRKFIQDIANLAADNHCNALMM